MTLNFKKLGEGEPLIILHGVFGSLDNWQSIGKSLAENHTVYLVDQRNHGLSFHSDEFNYELMAEDLGELMSSESLNRINILGHSMGGKTAMYFACSHPKEVKKLMVIDIAPKKYPPHHKQIFEGFKSVNLKQVETRKDAEKQMESIISNFGVRQFILKNLKRQTDGSWEWKLNLDAIEKNAENIGAPLPEDFRFEGETLFVAGEKSDYILSSDQPIIRKHFPKAAVETVPEAGHWVHAEKPSELYSLVSQFLNA